MRKEEQHDALEKDQDNSLEISAESFRETRGDVLFHVHLRSQEFRFSAFEFLHHIIGAFSQCRVALFELNERCCSDSACLQVLLTISNVRTML